ncbi:MAG: hypothetical protein ACSHYA_06705 [Opitutaceae bacterium]
MMPWGATEGQKPFGERLRRHKELMLSFYIVIILISIWVGIGTLGTFTGNVRANAHIIQAGACYEFEGDGDCRYPTKKEMTELPESISNGYSRLLEHAELSRESVVTQHKIGIIGSLGLFIAGVVGLKQTKKRKSEVALRQ